MKNEEKKGGFVAISDFHSNRWPIDEKIPYYLEEHDVIYILGDATDRGKDEYGYTLNGDGGVELLLDIMELCKKNPDRIVYVPGNHDEFVYFYAAHEDSEIGEKAQMSMERNYGRQTLEDLERLKKENPNRFNELVDWLGSLPLQRVHYDEQDGKKQRYCLAHAFFNESIYEQNPDFSLEDLFHCYEENGYYYPDFKESDITWYRPGTGYNANDVPSDSIIVIGHTPEQFREGQNLDLQNSKGEIIKVVCVDGGITYSSNNGYMKKYVSGKPESLNTLQYIHQPAYNRRPELQESKNVPVQKESKQEDKKNPNTSEKIKSAKDATKKFKIVVSKSGVAQIIGTLSQYEIFSSREVESQLKSIKKRENINATIYKGPLKEGTYKIDGKEYFVNEFGDVFDERNLGIMNTHRLLYAIYKTQERFDTFDRVIPNTEDMLMSIVDLNFSNFPNQEISTREGKARDIADEVLPYAYASCAISQTPENRAKAEKVGNNICYYLCGDYQDALSNRGVYSPPGMFRTGPDKAWLERLSERGILEIIKTIRYNTDRVINDDQFIESVTNKLTDFRYGDENMEYFPEVALINACYKMGDKDIEKLFTYTIDELKEHTLMVRKTYMASNQSEMSQEEEVMSDKEEEFEKEKQKILKARFSEEQKKVLIRELESEYGDGGFSSQGRARK